MIFVTACVVLAVACTTATSAASAPAYEMAGTSAATGGSPSIYRINVASGQVIACWRPVCGDRRPRAASAREYHLHIYQQIDGKTFWTERMDAESGRTWYVTGSTWTEVLAPK
jgi:hypothetical protein